MTEVYYRNLKINTEKSNALKKEIEDELKKFD